MNLDHVFAMGTVSLVGPDGAAVGVPAGSHWLADDPLVLAHPEAFTTDCRYGLAYSGEPPACLSIPPGQEDPEMTAKVRSRSHAERTMSGRAEPDGEPLVRGHRRSSAR